MKLKQLACAVVFAALSGSLEAQESAPEIKKLQRQLDALKRDYEKRINALTEEVERLKGQQPPAEEEDLEALKRLAEQEAAKEEEPEEQEDELPIFKALGLNLQELNPEISVTGDMIVAYRRDDERTLDRCDFTFRNLGLHFESYLDPYTKFKAAVPVNENEAKIGEAYMTRFGVLEGLNLTAGKFRQQFGVVNRWHKHGLDQVDFPLALREIFGPGGLNQTGISADWNMPSLLGSSQELTVQVTNGENGKVFSGNLVSTPSVLAHYKNYNDLSKDIYVELGATGLLGWNEEWDVGGATIHDELETRVYGVDLSMVWEPTDEMRYRNIEWRTELYLMDRDLLSPLDGQHDAIRAWGGYTYLQSLISRTWIVGARFDYFKPDAKTYATGSFIHPDEHYYQWQLCPYVTWYQSPFVHFRLEYDYIDDYYEEEDHVVMLQVIFAAGPHKHERY